jgi:hypothetical protein
VSGAPRAVVIYDTVYSNNTDELTNHYGTGSGQGVSDEHGAFHATWVLAPTVPAGPATINVGMQNGHAISTPKATFVIKPVGQSC